LIVVVAIASRDNACDVNFNLHGATELSMGRKQKKSGRVGSAPVLGRLQNLVLVSALIAPATHH
jgi:hypothetical protein